MGSRASGTAPHLASPRPFGLADRSATGRRSAPLCAKPGRLWSNTTLDHFEPRRQGGAYAPSNQRCARPWTRKSLQDAKLNVQNLMGGVDFMSLLDLSGKTILITGGCGAIGRVVVKTLAAHGAKVAVNDILDEAAALEELAS